MNEPAVGVVRWHVAFGMMLLGGALGAIGLWFAGGFWAGFLRAVNCP